MPDLYRPPLDPVIVSLCVLALAVAVVALYVVRHRSIVKPVLRLVALAAIAWVLAGPSVLDQHEKTGRVSVVMLTDTSASMAEQDAPGDVSRLDALRATWLDPAFLEKVRQQADLRLIAFDGTSRFVDGTDLAATGNQTQLFAALGATLAEEGHPITVLLSDGHDTRTVTDAAVVSQFNRAARPVFAVPVGRTLGVADVALQAWADADYVFDGQTVALNATVIQTGFDDQTVRVELFESGRRIDEQSITFGDEAAQSVRFNVSPQVDERMPVTLADYTLRVVTPREQRVVDNDEQTVFVQVSRDRMKVAIFEGEPNWDTRYLAQVVRADPQADLAAVYRFGPKRQVRVVSGRSDDETLLVDPSRITQAQLNAFDVVILGSHAERLFPGERAQLLVDYVTQRGGALVMARGRAFAGDTVAQAIIEPIEPVAWGTDTVERMRLALTPAGASSPLLRFDGVAPTDVILTELPGVVAATSVQREKAATMVLLRDGSTEAAALAHQHAGRGQVLAVLGEGLWKWALLPREQTAYDPVFTMFWTRAVRWLATGGDFLPGQDVAMKLDRVTLEPGEPVTVTLATRQVPPEDFAPVLTLVSPDGAAQVVEPKATAGGEYQAVLELKEKGVWRVELRDVSAEPRIDPATPITARLAVYDRSQEKLDPSARPRVLKQLAEATGGACWALDEPGELLRQIERVRAARESDVSARYDFNRGWVFAAIALALGGEWVLRRRGGLV